MHRNLKPFLLGLCALGGVSGTWAATEEFPYTDDGYLTCGAPARPSLQAICDAYKKHFKPDSPEDKALGRAEFFKGTVQFNYERVLRDLPMGGSEQQQVIAEQKAFLDRRDRCGSDLHCIGAVEEARNQALMALRRKLERPFPADAVVKLTQGWKTPEGEPLARRLLLGFNLYPLPRAILDSGYSLQWGFAPHAASLQSLAVFDPRGQIVALATADGVYRSALEADGPGTVRIYTPTATLPKAVLPALYSWAAADQLGFNLDCAGKNAEACRSAAQGPFPTFAAFSLSCTAKNRERCRLPLPETPSLGVPLERFRQ